MKNTSWICPTFVVVVAIVGFLFLVISMANSCSKMQENYLKPDTTIVIKNGTPDTTITIKSKPWWMQ